jgi:hypothetical protein
MHPLSKVKEISQWLHHSDKCPDASKQCTSAVSRDLKNWNEKDDI